MTQQIIKLKRGLKAKLEEVLVGEFKPQQGEPIFEIDTNKLKIGDGVNNYAALPYIGGDGGIQKLVYNSVVDLPSVGSSDTIYVIKNGNTYI